MLSITRKTDKGLPRYDDAQESDTFIRYGLLVKFLQIQTSVLPDLTQLLGNPFASPAQTLSLLQTWNQMHNTGFTFAISSPATFTDPRVN